MEISNAQLATEIGELLASESLRKDVGELLCCPYMGSANVTG